MDKNYHTHLALCNHAVGMTEDYVKKAISEGFVEIGISDHAPLPEFNVSIDLYKQLYLDENMDLHKFHTEYIPDILNARKKYRDIIIKLGLETEYIKKYHDFYVNLRKDVEYMILGQHFFMYNDELIDSYNRLTPELIIAYANSVKEALDTKMFSIIAHPDLFMYDYINNEFDEAAIKASRIILKACLENDVLVEINIRGMRKVLSNGEYRYPKERFFEIAKEYNVKFILGLDAHDPNEYDKENIKKGLDFCKKLNIKPVNM